MANPGVAVPGSVVAIGSQASPAGPQGIQGPSGGTSVSANANNKATLGTDSLVLVQGVAAGVAATTHAQTVSGDDPQLTNARTPSAHASTHVTSGSDIIVPASAATAGLLKQLSGNTTDFVDGTNACQNLVNAVQPTIWSARLRSYNAIGNSTFEVAQRNVRNTLANPAQGTMLEDRWGCGNLNLLGPTFGCPQTALTAGSGVVVPGTSFVITTAFCRITAAVQKITLAAGDGVYLFQNVDGPRFRELMSDVHSVQLMVRSSVANLKFGLSLRDTGNTRSLTKLCTLGAANTITLIQLPNLPIFPSAGNFTAAPGSASYTLAISVAAGSTFTAPANDTFQTGNFFGALGQDNLLATLSATFEIFFVQHEPGPLCTTPIDSPFRQNLEMDCLPYYQKSYDYEVAPGGVSAFGISGFMQTATTQITGAARFHKPMAKNPTVTGYNHASGAVNSIQHQNSSAYAITSIPNVGKTGFYAVNTATMPAVAAGAFGFFHYTADTGW